MKNFESYVPISRPGLFWYLYILITKGDVYEITYFIFYEESN